MIHKNKDGSYNMRTGHLSSFLSVIEEQYKVHCDILNKKPNPMDYTSDELIRINRQLIDPIYICIIFSAMYLEAFIYDYCSRKRSSTFAKSIDKLDPPGKWIIGTELCNLKGIDKSKQPYQKLKELFSLRNELAHNKSKEFNWDNHSDNQGKINLFQPIECINIVIEILKELITIDPDEIYAPIVIQELESLKKEYKT